MERKEEGVRKKDGYVYKKDAERGRVKDKKAMEDVCSGEVPVVR